MSLAGLIYRLPGDFLSLLFPRVCQCCGEHLVKNEDIICTSCIYDIPVTDFHNRRDNELEKAFWGRCYIERAAAWAPYTRGGKVQRLIHRLKYLGIKEIGIYIGHHYGKILKESGFLDGIDVIVPVPLHPSRERRRGFNQAMVLSVAISDVSGIPVREDILKRKRKTATQTRRTRVERWENVENIFEVPGGITCGDIHILLVDDVVTTGSTIESCVNALKVIPGVRVSVVSAAVALSNTI